MCNEYDAVIADLEAQRAELDLLIAGLRKRAGQSPDGGGGPGSREIHSATFFGKSITEAARIYLEMCNKRPQTPQQIAEALGKGGLETKASNFVAMLQTVLRRTEKATGEFIRTPAGDWALPEWFGKKATPRGSKDREPPETQAADAQENVTQGTAKAS